VPVLVAALAAPAVLALTGGKEEGR
jgi:hypothetical protein